jgi:hypothetical protein
VVPPVYSARDHRYMDEHSMAARYIENSLAPAERTAFEAHLVDCQECTDRILLAGMFHARMNGISNGHPPLPLRARVAARLRPWQILVIFAITALLLLAIPTALIPLWQLFVR